MIPFAEMGKRFPGLDWAAFFAASGLSEQSSVFVQTPPALAAGARLVAGVPLETWRDYLSYQYIKGCAEVLPLAFREEHFDFYTRSLGLQKTMRPRQAESIDTAKEKLQRFLGEEYVRLYVSEQTKAAAIAMVNEIKAAFDDRLARARLDFGFDTYGGAPQAGSDARADQPSGPLAGNRATQGGAWRCTGQP